MAHIVVNTKKSKGTINKNIYGQFSEHLGRCIYEGIFVKEEDGIPNVNGMRKDVVEALKAINVPVLRWPGGCFGDTYHWMDGIGAKENRKKIVNTNWGGVTEDNSFGTHEFLEFCKQVGCEPYISGNVGSGTVQELSDWIEYCNMGGVSPMADLRRKNGQEEPWNVKFWGIGNENWGCGGNMSPDFYASVARQFSTFMRNYDNELKVQETTLDKFVEDNNLNVGLITIDVEGAEMDLLNGALNTIKNQKPILHISIYHKASDFFEIIPWIANLELDYEFKIVKEQPWPFLADTVVQCRVK